MHPSSSAVSRTSRNRLVVLVAALAGTTASVAHASQALIDFGSPFTPTISTAGKYANNVINPLFGSTKLVDVATGAQTPWSLEVTKPFNGLWDTTGTTKPIGAAGQTFGNASTRDSFDASASLSTPQITFRNLATTDLFSFNLFASFMGGSANRTGTYTIRGATTTSGTLNATNNTSNLLSFNSIKPAADGTIRLDISAAASNNSMFKQVYLNALTVTGTHVAPPPTPAPGKNLLFFGNSFTALNDVPNLVGSFAVADGQTKPYIVSETADSRELADQLQVVQDSPQNNIGNLPAGKTWDNVVIQEFSSLPTHNGDPAEFRKDAVALYNAVKAKSPNVKPVLYETWAYRPTSTAIYSATPDDGQWTDATQMQAELRGNYLAAQADLNAIDGGTTLYAGVGDKWEQAGFPDGFYDTYDDKHPSTRGSTIAALVLYATIYHETVSDIPFSKVQAWADARGITAAEWAQYTTLVDTSVPLLKGASMDQIMAFAEMSAVPEPATFATLLITAGTMTRRRRR